MKNNVSDCKIKKKNLAKRKRFVFQCDRRRLCVLIIKDVIRHRETKKKVYANMCVTVCIIVLGVMISLVSYFVCADKIIQFLQKTIKSMKSKKNALECISILL